METFYFYVETDMKWNFKMSGFKLSYLICVTVATNMDDKNRVY